MTATLVRHLAESRPTAQVWRRDALAPADPLQPALDLRAGEPPVLVLPAAGDDRQGPAGVPDGRDWGVALATRLLEVMAGRRPAAQLSRWLSEEVLTGLLLSLPGGPGRPARDVVPAPRLRSVRLQSPRAGVAELSVHAQAGARSLAMALRLEAQSEGWLCTALELGPRTPPAVVETT